MITSFEILGVYFGYPTCCIEDFMSRVYNGAPTPAPFNQLLVGQRTGFIPCPACSKKILKGQIVLKDLITNRYCETSFPYGI